MQGTSEGPARGEQARVDGVEAVDVLLGPDRVEHLLLADLLGERELHEDPVDLLVHVETREHLHEGGLGRVGGQHVELAADAGVERRLLLVARVDLARRILADEDHLEPGRASVLLHERRDALTDLGADLLGKLLPSRIVAVIGSPLNPLEDAREDPVKVIEIFVRDHDLTLVALVADLNLGAGSAREAQLEVAMRRGLAVLALVLGARLGLRAADERLGGAHAEVPAHALFGHLFDLGGIGRAEERARMTFAEHAGDDARANGRRQLEQAQGVRDRRAVLAEAFGERLLRVVMLLHEAVERLGELDGVQVLALYVHR